MQKMDRSAEALVNPWETKESLGGSKKAHRLFR